MRPDRTTAESVHENNESMAAYEEEDEIVAEIPMYLSTKLAKHLYLIQYPMRNAPFTSKNGPVAARIKPNANMIELDIPLDTRSPYYNTERGEDFALGMNDKVVKTAYDKRMEELEEEQMYGRTVTKQEVELLDRMTLSSTSIPVQTQYAVGVLRDGELHITPLKSTVQMRQSLKYIDKIDEKLKAANKRASEVEKQEEKQPEPKAQAKSLQVSLRKADADNGPIRRNIYSMAVRNAEEEPWSAVVYYDERSPQAEVMSESLFASKKVALVDKTSRQEYLSKLSG